MASEANSKRRVREVAYAWIAVGALYLVGAVAWVISGRWPPPGYVVWGTIYAGNGWLWLRRGMPRDAQWILRPKVWFLATCLVGVLFLMLSLAVATDPLSRALSVIAGIGFLVVGLRTFVGEWIDDHQPYP
jgi:hypothetical protein